MTIEILYPQLCCLYGDKGNTKFLQACFPDSTFIFTELNSKPAFLTQKVDLCCMYSCSEQSQELILSRLLQWKDEFKEAMNTDTFFLFLGNAMELLGEYILREDGSKIECLGLFSVYSKRHAPNRFNTLIQAVFQDMTLLGYTSRFSDTYGIKAEQAFATVNIGAGSDPTTKLEGIYTGNLIATYLLGPLLVANPDFMKWLMVKLGAENPSLPFEEDLYISYEARRKEFQQPDLLLD